MFTIIAILLVTTHCMPATGVNTIYGVKCLSTCRRAALGYYYCDQLGGREGSWWDYCSTSNKVTIYGEKCKNTCRASRYSYSWCDTETSWDYCSSSGVGRSLRDYEDTPRVGNSLYWLFVLPCAVILCIGGYKVYTGTKLFKQAQALPSSGFFNTA